MELRSIGLAIALACAASVAAQAQQPATPPTTTTDGIGGFLAMSWGSKPKDVLNAYGQPLMDQTTPDSVRILVYKDNPLGKPLLALFYLDPQKGLVKGVYSAAYGEGSDCEVVFQKFRQFVQRLYPSIKADEKRRHEDPAKPFCDSATEGKASWSVDWVEGSTGNSVHLTLEPEEKNVDVAYQSRFFKPSAAATP